MAGPADFFDSLQGAPAPDQPAAAPNSGAMDFFKGLEEPKVNPTTPQYGQVETAARHGFQGLTMGLGDEMRGLGEVVGAGRPVADPMHVMHALGKLGYDYLTGNHENLDAYKRARDAYRKTLEESATQHPVTSTVSDVAGSLVTPGGEFLKGASLTGRALRGAALGAAQGAGRGVGEAPELSDVPASAVEGAAISAPLGAAGNALFGSKIPSQAMQAIKDTANKYGVQLPYYMVSDSPLIQSVGGILNQLPGVGKALGNAGERARQGVQNIRDEFVDKGIGIPNVTPTEARTVASEAARNSVDNTTEAFRQLADHDYSAVNKAMQNPNYRQQPNNLISEAADQITKLQGYGAEPGPILQKAINAIQVRGGLTYNALKDLRTDLFTRWRQMQDKGGTPYGDYVGLIGSITKDMQDTVRAAGGPRAEALWQQANATHAEGKVLKGSLQDAIGKGTKDTDAADKIFANISATKPNLGAVNDLKVTTPKADWDKIQAATLARMGADDAGNFSIDKFISANNKLSDAGKDVMFGASGPKREAYDAILSLGKAIKAVDQFKNTSKTATVGAALGAGWEIIQDIRSGNYTNTAGGLGAGALAAAVLSRPATARSTTKFAQALEKYMLNPAATATGKVPKALEVAARNFAIQMDNSKADRSRYINKFVAAPLGME